MRSPTLAFSSGCCLADRWEKRDRLPVQPRKSYEGAKASTTLEIEGHDLVSGDAAWRQNALPSVFQRRRQSHDRARAAQSDVITPVGPESTATRVQLRDSSGVPYDFPVPIERQDPIAAAVEEEQFLPLIDDKPARVGNTRVVAEGAERPAVAIESKQGSISIAVDTRRACNEERHDNITVSVPPRTAPRFSDELSKSLRQGSILLKDRHWEVGDFGPDCRA
jgi:hypothetical protein